jgi:hypothetical protein
MIIIKIDDELTIPFYMSTWLWNKPWVPTNKFYPIFWIWSDWYLNKWTESEIDNYYWSPLLSAIAKERDNREKDKTIDVSDWESSNTEFEKNANLWKNPISHKDPKNGYENINKTLKKISKIKDSD